MPGGQPATHVPCTLLASVPLCMRVLVEHTNTRRKREQGCQIRDGGGQGLLLTCGPSSGSHGDSSGEDSSWGRFLVKAQHTCLHLNAGRKADTRIVCRHLPPPAAAAVEASASACLCVNARPPRRQGQRRLVAGAHAAAAATPASAGAPCRAHKGRLCSPAACPRPNLALRRTLPASSLALRRASARSLRGVSLLLSPRPLRLVASPPESRRAGLPPAAGCSAAANPAQQGGCAPQRPLPPQFWRRPPAPCCSSGSGTTGRSCRQCSHGL